MSDETKQCAYEQCQQSLADVSPFVDVWTGRRYCSSDHRIAAANGDDQNE